MRIAFLLTAVGALALATGTASAQEVYEQQAASTASSFTSEVGLGAALYGEPGYSTIDLLGWARGNVQFGGGLWNVTGEVAGLAALSDPHFMEGLVAAHLYHQNDSFAHGVFVGYAPYGEDGFSGHEFGVGVQGAMFLPNTTLSANLGYFTGDNNDGDYHYWGGSGTICQYLTENTKLSGLVKIWGTNGFGVGAGAEHLFAGRNTSAFAHAAWMKEGPDTAWQITGGVRIFFHGQNTTLQQHDWDMPFALADDARF